ncbi:hypothetical protein [Cryptosporangium sp. NPDC048952]|uniref:hypothetical protein n=1 Tax=Cryptosporangium sp. NPDC048952 TaxID=3363961 RepID=UPI00371EA3A3
MSDYEGGLRPYLVWVRIDGAVRRLCLDARSAEDALTRPGRDLHNGQPRTYPTVEGGEAGEITVVWLNVATLEVGEARPADLPTARPAGRQASS